MRVGIGTLVAQPQTYKVADETGYYLDNFAFSGPCPQAGQVMDPVTGECRAPGNDEYTALYKAYNDALLASQQTGTPPPSQPCDPGINPNCGKTPLPLSISSTVLIGGAATVFFLIVMLSGGGGRRR